MDRLVNKKGQSPLTILFIVGVFITFWAFFLGKFLADAGAALVTQNNLTGIEAFIASNLNLWVGIALLIFIVWAAMMGGRG
jgi:hypothetical protein